MENEQLPQKEYKITGTFYSSANLRFKLKTQEEILQKIVNKYIYSE